MLTSRVVITGIGVVAPNGIGCAAFTNALRHGQSGIRRITEFDTAPIKTKSAATVINFDPLAHMSTADVRRTPRMVPFAVAAAREALAMANLHPTPENIDLPRQIGVALGTGGGGLSFVEAQYRLYFTHQKGYSPFTITSGTHGNLSSELSIHFGLRGPSHVITTGCTSSTDAIGYAAMLIRNKVCPVMLAGGADAPIAEGILKGFEIMRILADEQPDPAAMSRPFNRDRDGFVLGEGAWFFVLEDADFAARRGAQPLAEILAHASTCDAFHRVQPAPDATESARAINLALSLANLNPEDIDYVNLHGTSTQLNDALETKAMHLALGGAARRIPMSSTKSMIGHPQGACGAAGLAATLLAARAGFLHPTINLHTPDPTCDLDYIANVPREAPKRLTALCNCIAFGSKNSALVVRTT